MNMLTLYVVVVPWEGGTCVPSKLPIEQQLRYGLVVRIPGSHPGGPGSIPGNGKSFCKVHDAKKRNNNISANTQNAKSEQSDARNCSDKMEAFLYEDTQIDLEYQRLIIELAAIEHSLGDNRES